MWYSSEAALIHRERKDEESVHKEMLASVDE